jgi:hypothetical protein
LDNFAQLAFRGAITAVGVRMVTLHQLLEPRLDCRYVAFLRRRLPASFNVGFLASEYNSGKKLRAEQLFEPQQKCRAPTLASI